MSDLQADYWCADLRQEVRKLCTAWLAAGRYAPRHDAWLRSFDLDFSKELAVRGLIGMAWPVAVGGGGRSNVERLAVTEELLRAGAPVAAHWIGDRQVRPAIAANGSSELQEEILPLIASAEAVFCLGMSEPGAGSDLAAVRTTATPVANGWRVRGRKTWTSNAHLATHMYLLARTDPDAPRRQGLSEFVVDMAQPGITVSPIRDMTGGHHFNEVLLEDVFVPGRRLLGAVGNGWRQVTEQLAYERGGAERVMSTYQALRAVLARAQLEPSSLAYSALGGLVARFAVLRMMCLELARSVDAGVPSAQQAAMLKYLGTAFERDVLEVLRLVSPSGPVLRGSVLGEGLLVAPGFGLRGGASDVLLSIIARQERIG